MEYVDILLVEDNLQDAELTIRALRKHNASINLVHVKDGAEGLDFLFCKGQFSERNKKSHPKIVLLDLKMPKIDGLEVLRIIKSDPETRHIPVIILTSSKEERDLVESYHLGANSYILKPVEYEKFMEAVKDIGIYWTTLNQHRND